MGNVASIDMFVNCGANGEAVDDDGRKVTRDRGSNYEMAAWGKLMDAYQKLTNTTTFERLGFRSEFAKVERNVTEDDIGYPLGAPNNNKRWVNTSYHLGVYFFRFLLLCCAIDMVLAANDSPPQAITEPSRAAGDTKRWVIGGVGGGAVLVIVILILVVWYLCSRTRRLHKSSSLSNRQYKGGSTYSRYPYSEIVQATDNFDEARVIGEGGFGKVYTGTLVNGTIVAIKRWNGLRHQGEREFRAEIEMLLQLRHYHLISLLGYCEENKEMILVYEFMDNGTLRQHLCAPLNQPLMWKQRIKIAINSANGLNYLHTGFRRPIIHRDVKSSNILLDMNMVAKVSDFGLSKELLSAHNSTELSGVKGSFGYLDPEYCRLHRFTDKSDVYSLGVVLFELLCSRPALNKTLPNEQVVLAEWVLHCYKNKILDQIIDPYLHGEILPNCLELYVETAVKCLAAAGKDRPSMGDVLVNLQHALELQESADTVLEMPPEGFNNIAADN